MGRQLEMKESPGAGSVLVRCAGPCLSAWQVWCLRYRHPNLMCAVRLKDCGVSVYPGGIWVHVSVWCYVLVAICPTQLYRRFWDVIASSQAWLSQPYVSSLLSLLYPDPMMPQLLANFPEQWTLTHHHACVTHGSLGEGVTWYGVFCIFTGS